MSNTLERPSADPKVPVRSSLSAWLTLFVWAALYPVALGVAFALQDTAGGGAVLLAWTLLPPATGIALGARAARTGNRSGALATAFGLALVTFLVVFYVGANFLLTDFNDSAPAALAVAMALVVGGAVEAAWHRWLNRWFGKTR